MHPQTQVHEERPLVLVVGAEALVLDDIRSYLTTYGFAVDTATERTEAEVLLGSKAYSLVVADQNVAAVRGRGRLGLLSVTRSQCPGARFVLVAPFDAPELQSDIVDQETDAVVGKPLILSELAAIGHRLLKMPVPQFLASGW
jgi:DNA-binding response OmpR family regulator